MKSIIEFITSIDFPTLVNWIISALIGCFFGGIGAWIVYRFQIKRDAIKWEQKQKQRETEWIKEQEQRRKQWEHDRELLIIESQQRLLEFEQQWKQQEHLYTRDTLIEGIHDPNAISQSITMTSLLEADKNLQEEYIQAIKRHEELSHPKRPESPHSVTAIYSFVGIILIVVLLILAIWLGNYIGNIMK